MSTGLGIPDAVRAGRDSLHGTPTPLQRPDLPTTEPWPESLPAALHPAPLHCALPESRRRALARPLSLVYAPPELRFLKYEGLGNDFVLLEEAELGGVPLTPAEAVAICDRHLGVGADGVLVIEREPWAMRVHNADGSMAQMCGNGLRCVALHLQGAGAGDEFVVETDSGPHACRVIASSPQAEVEVAMRAAEIDPARVPVTADAPLIDAAFDLEGSTLRLSAVSMGNPHAVLFDLSSERASELGPRLSVDPRFPEGVNAGFVTRRGDVFELRVHERGVGWTRACGTGACAAAYAAVLTGRAARHAPIVIELPGGRLTLEVGEDGSPILMRGRARHVFDGTLSRERLLVP